MEEDIILDEIKKELNHKEKLLIKVFKKTFNKIVNKVRIIIVNSIIK